MSDALDRAEAWLESAEDQSVLPNELRQQRATLAIGWALLALLEELKSFQVVAVDSAE